VPRPGALRPTLGRDTVFAAALHLPSPPLLARFALHVSPPVPWLRWTLLLSGSLCLLSGLLLPVLVWAAPAAITITSPLPQVGEVSASARYVAWTATQMCTGQMASAGCSPQAIYLYDLQKRVISVAARTIYGQTGAIYHYHVTDRWLAYLDTGLHGSPAVGAWRIVALNLTTQRSIVVAQSSRADTVTVPPDLALAGANLVWTSGHEQAPGKVRSSIAVTDLRTGRTRPLASTISPFSYSFPDTDGMHVVWERDDFTSAQPSSAIVGLDLDQATSTPRVLSGSLATLASQPTVSGMRVAWKSGPGFAPGAIMLSTWDSRAAPRQISRQGEAAFSPAIGDDFVAWSTGSTGRVNIYTLRTKRMLLPSGSQADWIYGFPTTAGHWLAYSYMTGLPPHEGGPAPRGYVKLSYLGSDAAVWMPILTG